MILRVRPVAGIFYPSGRSPEIYLSYEITGGQTVSSKPFFISISFSVMRLAARNYPKFEDTFQAA